MIRICIVGENRRLINVGNRLKKEGRVSKKFRSGPQSKVRNSQQRHSPLTFSLLETMDQLVADLISRMGLALPVAILVAVRAGQMLLEMNSLNMETKVTEVTIDVVKEQIVYHLEIIFRVYRDTTEDVNLPTDVNLQEVSAHLFFVDERVSLLHNIYCDLLSQGTQSEYFLQVIQFLGRVFLYIPEDLF